MKNSCFQTKIEYGTISCCKPLYCLVSHGCFAFPFGFWLYVVLVEVFGENPVSHRSVVDERPILTACGSNSGCISLALGFLGAQW